ncbi:hypothetical protein SAMN04488587_1971 [Methanococcoides vulcani]|uniref:Uncharacterized protein n=1 Tax=Methanococcoides vulcani TaxID=1353158 RepID=A0A1I0B4J5_9EURY|nr:hypothetical protein SAMN04488587_1971 [Methanococcoides vulcani]
MRKLKLISKMKKHCPHPKSEDNDVYLNVLISRMKRPFSKSITYA